LVGVVSAPDRPAGRGGSSRAVPVAVRARDAGLTLLQPVRVRSADALEALAALVPGLGVLADYGQIVPPAVLALPRFGILNVHPSLLPRHRGATPVAATILAGDREAGVTVIRMDAGLDTGPIVAAEAWPLAGTETAPELEARAAAAGAALLLRSLGGWLDGSLVARPQDDAGATSTRPLRRDDGRLDPALGAEALERQVRAYQPWPGSFLETPAGRLVVWRASPVAAGVSAAGRPPEGSQHGHGSPVADGGGSAAPRAIQPPGELVPVGRGLALVTATAPLVLAEVQLAGRRRMSGEELRRGYPGLVREDGR
jgi:methionyl-tRNA formyltransferase